MQQVTTQPTMFSERHMNSSRIEKYRPARGQKGRSHKDSFWFGGRHARQPRSDQYKQHRRNGR